jgi:hypothetical protein
MMSKIQVSGREGKKKAEENMEIKGVWKFDKKF